MRNKKTYALTPAEKEETLKAYKKQKAKSIKRGAKNIVTSKKSKYDVKDVVREVSAMKHRKYKDLPNTFPKGEKRDKGETLGQYKKRKLKAASAKEKKYRKRIGQ